jgi:hypothetical protein
MEGQAVKADYEQVRQFLLTEQEATLDDILSRWHSWQRGDRLTDGHSGRATAFGDSLTSRQYDDMNGALDAQLETTTMRQVDFEVSEIPDPWRSALHALARSLYTGHAVFHSPRIPPEDRAHVSAEARMRIIERLIAAGIM